MFAWKMDAYGHPISSRDSSNKVWGSISLNSKLWDGHFSKGRDRTCGVYFPVTCRTGCHPLALVYPWSKRLFPRTMELPLRRRQNLHAHGTVACYCLKIASAAIRAACTRGNYLVITAA